MKLPKRCTVYVSRDIIRRSRRWSSAQCVLATALRQRFPRQAIQVWPRAVFLPSLQIGKRNLLLTPDASGYARAFDEHGAAGVKPGRVRVW